ncbi:hypothetical protein OCH239_16345 [Roseivivax halodurans JCM 10272]|uniref:Uncharacterized protein n=1 Tax=Roseivivax halodurans JCM 10272 TaxID=1449350 RepID=X7EI10_9RHOB|nr:hypothetical protein [Roseivivax halodurans]ETX15500.1 hypothetical protein OCH239_16345 [Roseivivax halodurans JCM 10272]
MSFARLIGAAALLIASGALAADHPEEVAREACLSELGGGGSIILSSFSEAGTEVILEDATGTVWRCIGYRDGAVGLFERATAEQEAAARSAPKLEDFQEEIRFAPGSSGTVLTRALGPGGAFQFLLDARDGQTLRVRLTPGSGEVYYIIRNPDDSILSGGTDAGTAYEGRLVQTGEHVIEVVNQTSETVDYELAVTIE